MVHGRQSSESPVFCGMIRQGRELGVGNYQAYLGMIGRIEFPDPYASTYADGDCSFASVRQSLDFSLPSIYMTLKLSKHIASNMMLELREAAQCQIQGSPTLWKYLQNNLGTYLSARCRGIDDDDSDNDPQTAEDILKLLGKPFANGVFIT